MCDEVTLADPHAPGFSLSPTHIDNITFYSFSGTPMGSATRLRLYGRAEFSIFYFNRYSPGAALILHWLLNICPRGAEFGRPGSVFL